jgi:hypothetical protein
MNLAVGGTPSDDVVGMPLAVTDRKPCQLGSWHPDERLVAASLDKRLAATEPYGSSVCDGRLSFGFTYWAGYTMLPFFQTWP